MNTDPHTCEACGNVGSVLVASGTDIAPCPLCEPPDRPAREPVTLEQLAASLGDVAQGVARVEAAVTDVAHVKQLKEQLCELQANLAKSEEALRDTWSTLTGWDAGRLLNGSTTAGTDAKAAAQKAAKDNRAKLDACELQLATAREVIEEQGRELAQAVAEGVALAAERDAANKSLEALGEALASSEHALAECRASRDETESGLQRTLAAVGVSTEPVAGVADLIRLFSDEVKRSEARKGQVDRQAAIIDTAREQLAADFYRSEERPPGTLEEAVDKAIAHHAEHHAADRLEFRPAYQALFRASQRRAELLADVIKMLHRLGRFDPDAREIATLASLAQMACRIEDEVNPPAAAPGPVPSAAPAPQVHKYYCAGEACPGLGYPASELAHPPSCLGEDPSP